MNFIEFIFLSFLLVRLTFELISYKHWKNSIKESQEFRAELSKKIQEIDNNTKALRARPLKPSSLSEEEKEPLD
jgi:hypothetical protein